MRLPSNKTLYQIMLFLLFGMVIIGILFDTDFS